MKEGEGLADLLMMEEKETGRERSIDMGEKNR